MSPKRSASVASSANGPAAKKRRLASDVSLDSIDVEWADWPAPRDKIEGAKAFIRECAENDHPTLIVPDKDADGLSSGALIHHTLTCLSMSPSRIMIYHVPKGRSIFDQEARDAIDSFRCTRIIILDQGSQSGRIFSPITRSTENVEVEVKALLLDHHHSTGFPECTLSVTACESPPIATSSMLTYHVCREIHFDIAKKYSWLALIGIFGDLGSQKITFDGRPWPVELGSACKSYKKVTINEAVSLLNAPRRTPSFDVRGAWDTLLRAATPKDVADSSSLKRERDRVNQEVDRVSRAPPKFSKDGRVALVHLTSAFQVHPVLASRWSHSLKSKKLQMIMVANDGYSLDRVHFSCRTPASLRTPSGSQQPNLIEILKEYGKLVDKEFLNRVGRDFAKGHTAASGGIINEDEFKLLCQAMEIGVKAEVSKNSKEKAKIEQNNRWLTDYFKPVHQTKSGSNSPKETSRLSTPAK